MPTSDQLGPAKSTFEKVLKDRWDHPVAGPFLFSWFMCHLDLFVVLFSEGAYNIRVEYLREHFPLSVIAIRSAIALALSLAYVIVAQFSDPIQELAGILAKWTKGIVVKISPGRSFTQTEYNSLQQECSLELQKAQLEFSALEEQLKLTSRANGKALQNALETSNKLRINATDLVSGLIRHVGKIEPRSPGSQKAVPMNLRINGVDVDVLKTSGLSVMEIEFLITLSDGGISDPRIISSDTNYATIHHHIRFEALAFLVSVGLVYIEWDADQMPVYNISQGGRELLIEMNWNAANKRFWIT